VSADVVAAAAAAAAWMPKHRPNPGRTSSSGTSARPDLAVAFGPTLCRICTHDPRQKMIRALGSNDRPVRSAASTGHDEKEEEGDRQRMDIVTVRNDKSGILDEGGTASGSGSGSPEMMQQQAERLRREADRIRLEVDHSRRQKKEKADRDVDRWLNRVLVRYRSEEEGGSPAAAAGAAVVEVLSSPEEAADHLVRGRYSPEQVYRMFERLCELSNVSGRDSLFRNEQLRVLVDAAGLCDMLEPEINPNKRWRGPRVEHELYKKLFAKEWGIHHPLPTSSSLPSSSSSSSLSRPYEDE
jgi:hypothetical protein